MTIRKYTRVCIKCGRQLPLDTHFRNVIIGKKGTYYRKECQECQLLSVKEVLERKSMPTFKFCAKCGTKQAVENFPRNKQTKDGLYAWCRSCSAKSTSIWIKKKRKKDYRYRLYMSSKSNSSVKDVEHTVKVKDIVIPQLCPYLGVPLCRSGERSWDSPSIDRIDPTKGYTPDNIQIISDLANRMKQDATPEQLVAFAEGVLRLQQQPNLDALLC